MRLAALVLVVAGCADARAPGGLLCSDPHAVCDRVHPIGVADPASADFHGELLRNLGWNFSLCQGCHGADFAGGASGVSCLKCHPSGPTACTNCHAQPPSSGAHTAHLAGGALGKQLACTECHVAPAVYTDAGHLFAPGGGLEPSAQVTLGKLAATTVDPAARSGPPAWDGARCSNVYCHGAAFTDANATNRTPTWRAPGTVNCGACHGLPPSSHARTTCVECHSRVVDASGAIVDHGRHLDGVIDVGDGSGTCAACHPSPGGAHASHTGAKHALAKPIACTECHSVPATVDGPGHIDHQGGAIVFPPGAGPISRSDGAQPAFSAQAAQCSSVYCHGGGAALLADASPAIQRSPVWTAGSGAADCGACHGIPPTTAAHAGSLGLADCARCHPTTMNASGAIIEGGTHLDGKVDAQ